uniref:Rap guanine nucleotide exchange factor 6-like n=1 Tax=Geotrypetes seraphini TaxID=260995 RepID=A0A6P8SHP9_GEOSA|nr:rap guanine nucleotide exchange factor 6-like [Geotrypetes seraphini]
MLGSTTKPSQRPPSVDFPFTVKQRSNHPQKNSPEPSRPRSDEPCYTLDVIKVYKADQYRYIRVSRITRAEEVANQAVHDFALTKDSETYSLAKVSVSPDGVKQGSLPDNFCGLADRLHLNERYYLKNNNKMEHLCSNKAAQKLLKKSKLSLLQLCTVEVATQLSVRDLKMLQNIDPTEYIEELFRLGSRAGHVHLKKYEELSNNMTIWVVTETLSEANQKRRMKTIKHFIKIAMHCKKCKNFNAAFAIMGGLTHSSVTRLRGTWAILPNKYKIYLEDLQDFFSPSGNMRNYRNSLRTQSMQPPVIPLFPLVKKDLFFLHEGNDSMVEGLVNFEKRRLIANNIRTVSQMAFANMAPALIFKQRLLSQSSTYPELLTAQGSARIKQTRKSLLVNAKKLYKDTQMARQVKQYLSNLYIEMDEKKLQFMSLQCEPAYSLRTGSFQKYIGVAEEAVDKKQSEGTQNTMLQVSTLRTQCEGRTRSSKTSIKTGSTVTEDIQGVATAHVQMEGKPGRSTEVSVQTEAIPLKMSTVATQTDVTDQPDENLLLELRNLREEVQRLRSIRDDETFIDGVIQELSQITKQEPNVTIPATPKQTTNPETSRPTIGIQEEAGDADSWQLGCSTSTPQITLKNRFQLLQDEPDNEVTTL